MVFKAVSYIAYHVVLASRQFLRAREEFTFIPFNWVRIVPAGRATHIKLFEHLTLIPPGPEPSKLTLDTDCTRIGESGAIGRPQPATKIEANTAPVRLLFVWGSSVLSSVDARPP